MRERRADDVLAHFVREVVHGASIVWTPTRAVPNEPALPARDEPAVRPSAP